MFETLFGPTFASAVVNSSLGLNDFLLTKTFCQSYKTLSFVVGQPLGFKGSWSLFALHITMLCGVQREEHIKIKPNHF